MAKFTPKLHAIVWRDAYGSTDDVPEFKDPDRHLSVSYGCIVRTDKHFIYVSHCWDGISQTWDSPWTAIPKHMVVEKRPITHANGEGVSHAI